MLKDITGIGEEAHTRKRIKPHLREHELRDVATNHGAKLDRLLALASYRAEEIRAADGRRPMDMAVALAGFEGNPFRWEARGWQSQVEVCFFWSWRGTDGVESKRFVFAMLQNVLARRVPRPTALMESDADVFRCLLEVAAAETAHNTSPCKYFGVQLGKGKYERDPAKW